MKNLLIIILLSLAVSLFSDSGSGDTRYDASMNLPFNEKAGDVNPQTGNITISAMDVNLPGRAGFNFSFGRTWSLNQSNVFNMYYNNGNRLNSNTVEKYNNMGVGWNTTLPYIAKDRDNSNKKVLNLFLGGSVYTLNIATINSRLKSNIVGYDLTDMKVYLAGNYPEKIKSYNDFGVMKLNDLKAKNPDIELEKDNMTIQGEYVLDMKTGEASFFRKDGKLMMSQDKTGLNKIWYFYNVKSQLILVVDSIGREITFDYTPEGQISSINWYVIVGKKDTNGNRESKKELRRVIYKYKKADQYGSLGHLKGSVIDYVEPYALDEVVQAMGHTVKYNYSLESASFSFDKFISEKESCNLLLTTITNIYTEDGKFLNKRCLEYKHPYGEKYRKDFYKGFFEYFKISKDQYEDKNGNSLKPITYRYYNDGEHQNRNCYTAEVSLGDIKTTYLYELRQTYIKDHLLSKKIVETKDGFYEETKFKYETENNTISEVQVKRKEEDSFINIYTENFKYDKKGNLTNYTDDRSGLIKEIIYHSIFSIPIEQYVTLNKTTDGDPCTYESKATINDKGQVISQEILVEGKWLKTEIEYDEYGNQIKVIKKDRVDSSNDITIHTKYDEKYNLFPVRIYQDVTIDSWGTGSIEDNWLSTPTSKPTITMSSRKLFNTDGTVWIEIDNDGYAIEHYYDTAGTEIETVIPDEDDFKDFSDDVSLESLNSTEFFSSRNNNPSVRLDIDYQGAFIKSIVDVDLGNKIVKVTGVEKNGLDLVLKEIVYNPDGSEYSVKKMEYDDLGRLVAITDPDAEKLPTNFYYNGNIVNNYTEKTWLIAYDELGRKTSIRYPITREEVDKKIIEYDDINNIVTTTNPEGMILKEHYDWAGNLLKVTREGLENGSTRTEEISFDYDSLNRKICFTDAEDLITKYFYDERSLLTKQCFIDEGYNESDLMEYDDFGRLIKKTDRKGQIIEFFYDELGRNTEAKHSSGGEVKQIYDMRGNPVRIENQHLIEYYTYNSKNLVTKIERRLKDTDVRGKFSNIWNNNTPESQTFSFMYKYNDVGIIKEMTYPDGSVHAFDYDELVHLKSIKENNNPFITDISYNKSGVVTSMNYANETSQVWSFDNRKRIKHIGIKKLDLDGKTSSIYADLNYSLNGLGNVTRINENEYEYDSFNRITKAKSLIPERVNHKDTRIVVAESFGAYEEDRYFKKEADLTEDGRVNGADHIKSILDSLDIKYDEESFEYDKNGNRTKLIQNGDEYNYTYGVRNRLESITLKKKGEATSVDFAKYEYDANGNTIRRTYYRSDGENDITEFTYDIMNRLIETTINEVVSSTNYYDNAGNRLLKVTNNKTTLYLRHGQIAVAMDVEIPTNKDEYKAKTNRYVLSGDLLAGRVTTTYKTDDSKITEPFYYHLDHLNSTKVVTKEDGSLDCIYEYRAFGEELKKIGEGDAKYTYGGKELDDDTNLYYFNARFYDPTTGRFINVDPIQDGTNWYVYCSNNPMSFVDPTGLYEILGVETKDILPEEQVLKERIMKFSGDLLKASYQKLAEANEATDMIQEEIIPHDINSSEYFKELMASKNIPRMITEIGGRSIAKVITEGIQFSVNSLVRSYLFTADAYVRYLCADPAPLMSIAFDNSSDSSKNAILTEGFFEYFTNGIGRISEAGFLCWAGGANNVAILVYWKGYSLVRGDVDKVMEGKTTIDYIDKTAE